MSIIITDGLGSISGPAPIIDPGSVIPAAGSTITANTPLSFSFTFTGSPLLEIINVTFQNPNISEVAHDGQRFGPNYQNPTNSLTLTDGGQTFNYTVLRDGGWPASPTITPFMVDASGGEDT